MTSNYPPGVTGNEPAIAGYREVEITQWCTDCQADTFQIQYYPYDGTEANVQCTECGKDCPIDPIEILDDEELEG